MKKHLQMRIFCVTSARPFIPFPSMFSPLNGDNLISELTVRQCRTFKHCFAKKNIAPRLPF